MTRQLDDVQDDHYRRSTLHGDAGVEYDSQLPVHSVAWFAGRDGGETAPVAESTRAISLSGTWLMGSCPAQERKMSLRVPFQNADQRVSEGILRGWHRPGADRSDWISVTVPTTVQRALIDAGLLEDPMWGTNTVDEQDRYGTPTDVKLPYRKTRVEQQEWWFATTFAVPVDWAGESLELYFDGLDYSATVYLNGFSLGFHEGMFGGPALDVTGLVSRSEPNELVVRFHPAPEHWDGVLKGNPGWGWHYGHLITAGIWRDVTLRDVPPVRIDHPFIRTIAIEGGTASLEVALDLVSRVTDAVPVDLQLRIRALDGSSENVVVASARQVASFGMTRVSGRIELPDAKTWWPAGYGDQPLYEAVLEARYQEGGQDHAESTSTEFGVRTIEMATVPGLEGEEFYRWRFVVNGRPLFVKGANWCWTDIYLARPFSERTFELARRSNVQLLRAWGAGPIESDEFYRACDRVGMMVFQEFAFSDGPNDALGTDLGVVDRQAQRIVRRLRNHPSLVLWGGGNENNEPLGGDEPLFLLGRRCRGYDPSRPYHRSEPWGGSLHNYDVYHEGRPMPDAYVSKPAVWQGEYGIPSMPAMANVAKYLPPDQIDHWPPTEADRGVIAHMAQFSLHDFFKIMRYADYGPIRDWDTFVAFSQLAQLDAHRFVSERQRAHPVTATGFTFYKIGELFPCASWGIIDYHLAPKPAYYSAKRFCSPRLAFATYDQFDWAEGQEFTADVHLSNDTPAVLPAGLVRATIYDADLRAALVREFAHPDVPADSTINLGTVTMGVDGPSTAPFFLAIHPSGGGAASVTDSWYWFNVRAKTDTIRELDRAKIWQFPLARMPEAFDAYASLPPSRLLTRPQTHLHLRLESDATGTRLMVRNAGNVPALTIVIDDGGDGTLGFLSDNHFSLHPGTERAITLELDPGQDPATFTAAAWNAPRVGLS